VRGWWMDEIGCRAQEAGPVGCSEVVGRAWMDWDGNGWSFSLSTTLIWSW
jgi:hypothetical protein